MEIYKEVLRDVSAQFDGAEDLIKTKIEEICHRKETSLEEVIFFCLFVCKVLYF